MGQNNKRNRSLKKKKNSKRKKKLCKKRKSRGSRWHL
jgi:hypothetical protein